MTTELKQFYKRQKQFDEFLTAIVSHYHNNQYENKYDYTAHAGNHRFNKKDIQKMLDAGVLEKQSIDAIVIESKITNMQHQISKNTIETYKISPYSIQITSTNNTIKIPLIY